MTGDLVAFLRARLDDDAQLARWAEDGAGQSWEARFTDHLKEHMGLAETGCSPVFVDGFLDIAFGAAEHAARHDPARTLAEVEAKRELITAYEAADRNSKLPHPEHVSGTYFPAAFVSGYASALEHALRLFALAYATHPDYREEWRP